jgi:hypothetical protein
MEHRTLYIACQTRRTIPGRLCARSRGLASEDAVLAGNWFSSLLGDTSGPRTAGYNAKE